MDPPASAEDQPEAADRGRRPAPEPCCDGTRLAPRWRGLLRWLVAIAASLGALGTTLALRDVVDPTIFVLFFGAVAVSAWFGGLGPGILSTVLSAWLIHQYIAPPSPLAERHIDDLIRLALFVGVAILISSLSDSLRRAQATLRAIIRASPVAIVTLDCAGQVRGWNPAARRTFGWATPQMLGRPLPLATTEEGGAATLWDRVRSGEIIQGVEARMAVGDGGEIDLSLSAAPLPDASGRASGIIALAEDITERNRVLDALRDAQEETRQALERERRIAGRFQAALLPDRPVEARGYAIAHTYRPALIEADVGGDFYNLFPVDDDRLGLVIGDVGGKGLDAAVIGARMQHAVAALALHEGGRPDVVIEGARRAFEAIGDPERLVTLFLAILDRETGHVEYASAGHEPALVWRSRDRRVETLTGHGPALFAVPAGGCRRNATVLAPGDIIVLYTDGLVDARQPTSRDLLGVERVAAVLAERHGEGPPAVLNALYHAALTHSAGNLRDDIALLALQRLEDPSQPGEYVFVTPPAGATG